MHVELLDKYKEVSNELRLLKEITECKRKIAEEKSVKFEEPPKDEVIPEKKPADRKIRLKKIREQFDKATGPSGPTPDQSEQ